MKTGSITLVISVLAALCPAAFAETNLAITGIQAGPGNTMVIAWPSEAGRWYRLEQTTDLVSGAFETVFPSTDATPPANFYTNTVSGTGACFYRVVGDTADWTQTDRGTSGNDTQVALGTTNRDRIVQLGYEGDDVQFASGLNADDWIEQYGDGGSDTQTGNGGSGDDLIFQDGGPGNDRMVASGDQGNDRVNQYGGTGNDDLLANGGDGNDYIYLDGGTGDDWINVDAGAGDDQVRINGGTGIDSITYNASAGNDDVYIDGGEDSDTLTINANAQSFAVHDAQGTLMYQSGTGGSVITVVNVEHGTIVASGGTTLYSW